MTFVMTKAVSAEAAHDLTFAKFVAESLQRFNVHDWGITSNNDSAMNDEDPRSAMGSYIMAERPKVKIWIKSDDYGADQPLVITVLFPNEY